MRQLQASQFGELLRRQRVGLGLTQEELAERAGLSVRGISDLERGIARRPQRETFRALAGALQLSSRDRERLEAAAGYNSAAGVEPGARRVPPAPLLGRFTELAAIERHVTGDAPPVLMLGGEPGIGKSRLLHEAAKMGVGEGFTVLSGGGQRRSGQEAYAPLLATLSRSIHGVSAARLRLALTGCAWLVRLLPELLDIAPMPLAGDLPADQEQRLIFAAVARYLANIAGPAGTLLILDDLQWSDPDGLDLLAALVGDTPGNQIRIVGAYRTSEVDSDHPLSALLADLAEHGLAEHLILRPLGQADTMALLDFMLPIPHREDETLKQQIVTRADGLPFFVVSCALSLLNVGSSAGDPDAVPWNVAQSIRQRVAVLPEQAREILHVAAVVGRVAPISLLRTVSSLDDRMFLTGLETACRTQLLIEEDQHNVRFAHDVIREVVEAELGAPRRILLHRAVGDALEDLPEGERKRRAAELAWHFLEGEDTRRGLLYTIEAGDSAAALSAYDEAERQFRTASALARELEDRSREADALEKLGHVLRTTGRYDQALLVLDQAVDRYEAGSNPDAVGRVAGKIGWAHSHRGTPADGIARLQALATRLEEVGPTAGLAEIYGALVHLEMLRGRGDECVTYAQRAWEIALAVGDDRTLLRGELNRGLALVFQNRPGEAVQVLSEVALQAEKIHDADTLFRALIWTSTRYADIGELESGRAYAERAIDIAERIGSASFLTTALVELCRVLFQLGDWSTARTFGDRAVGIAPQLSTWAGVDAHLALAEQAIPEGRWEAAAEHLASAGAISEQSGELRARPYIQALWARTDLLQGRPAAALVRLQACELNFRRGDVLRQVLAEALVDAGSWAPAAEIVGTYRQEAQTALRRLPLVGWLRLEGMLLAHRQDWVKAETAFKEGVSMATHMPYPYGMARILFEWGRMCAVMGHTKEAAAKLEEAEVLFRRLGAQPHVAQTEHALAQLD